MKAGLDARLARLESQNPPPKLGREFVMLEVAGDDREQLLRESGIELGPDDEVLWVELVGVKPRARFE